MDNWNPRPLPAWALKAWAQTDGGTFLVTLCRDPNDAGAILYHAVNPRHGGGVWQIDGHGHAWPSSDVTGWIPLLKNKPIADDDFWRRCLETQMPPEGREWVDAWKETKPGQWMSPAMGPTDDLEGLQLVVSETLAFHRFHRPIPKPLPPPGIYRLTFSDGVHLCEWEGPEGRLWVYAGSRAQTRSPADVNGAWVRLVPEAPETPAPAGPEVGVWLGRAPTVEERVAFAKGRHGHRSHHPPEDLGWWACVYDDGEVAPCLFRGDGALNHTLDAAPARDEAHARELCEARRRESEDIRRAETLGQMIEEVQSAGYTVLDVGGRPVERAEREKCVQERDVCEQQRQPSDPFPEGLVALAQREASAGPRITLVPESVVTLTDEDRRALDALAAKVGIPTLAGEEDAEASTAVGEATLAAVGEDIRPMIGQWIRDRDGDVFLLLAHVSDACDVYGSALAPNGDSACVELDGAEIITPPDPIPAPCHPVWEAFEALRRERSRTAAVTPEPPPGPAEGDVWAEIIAGLDESDPLRALAVERRQFGIDKYGTPLQRGNGRNHRADLLQEYLDAWAYAHALGDARETLYTAAAVRRLWGQLELKANPTTTNP